MKILLERGEKVLVYAEQGMWWNYRKPRPLTAGAFKFAAESKVPVLPIFITMSDSDKIGGDGFPHSVPVHWVEYVPVQAENEISVGDLGVDDEIKFNSLGQNGVIYERGLVSTHSETLNVDINSLKTIMSKD